MGLDCQVAQFCLECCAVKQSACIDGGLKGSLDWCVVEFVKSTVVWDLEAHPQAQQAPTKQPACEMVRKKCASIMEHVCQAVHNMMHMKSGLMENGIVNHHSPSQAANATVHDCDSLKISFQANWKCFKEERA